MTVEEDFVAFILAIPAVSGAVVDRVEPLHLSQDSAMPAITYQVISTPREKTHTSRGKAHPRIQLNCYDKTYIGAKAVAKAIRVGCDGFKGSMNGRQVDEISVQGENDDYDSVTERYRRIVDVIIWHKEEVT